MKNSFLKKIRAFVFPLLLLLLCVYSGHGFAMTSQETNQSITIPIQTWTEWKNDWMILDSELTACKSELQKIKKPSSELLLQLQQAEKMLQQLQEELQKQSGDLITLSRQVDESKTELQTLRGNINNERKIHKRQIWQNRLWFLLAGAVIGVAAGK